MLHDIPVHLGERSYRILIGSGILGQLGARCADAGLSGKCLVVTDENTGGYYAAPAIRSLEEAGVSVEAVSLPPGEQTKSGGPLFTLYSSCVRAGLDRQSFLVALGGGVIGDLAGYAAASFLRGIRFVQVPTSLLAMLDSSAGGKTGINIPEGKNLVGAFHQPELVLADLDMLSTLPSREYAAGLAEAVKYGLIYDALFFGMLEKHLEKLKDAGNTGLLAQLVGRSCEIKAAVVAEDEHDRGRRAILNFGHTAGHALEKAAGYGRYIHGEAVAVGCVYAARASVELAGLSQKECSRIEQLFAALRLPVSAPGFPWKELREAISTDKKTVGRTPKFVLIPEIGTACTGNEIPEYLMERIWNGLNK